MDFFDDLKVRAMQTFEDAKGDVMDYINNRWIEPAVKIGEPAKGNQTAEQIAQGQYGGQTGVPVNTSNSATLMNANPLAAASQQLTQYLPLMVLGLGALLILKKGK